MTVEKRRRCLNNREAAKLAVRIFNGETAAAIAAELGVSASYLGRLIARAKKASAFRYEVARE